MYSLSIALVVCLAAVAHGLPGPQIVGGKDAPIGKFPYQISMRKGGRHFCGGSIISPRYILTAAHCVAGVSNPATVTIHAGTNQLNSNGDAYQGEKIVSHPGYDSRLLVNDVALIRVNRNIAMSANVKPITLATGTKTYEGSSCILSGWGTTKAGGSVPNNLQYINLMIESKAKCRQVHSNVQDSHICTFTKYGEGACNGDSGGPLVVNGVQVGVVSFGIPCGVGKPDVYTRVSSFASWIKQQQTFLMSEDEAQADFDMA
ncbi:chymotrypsin-1-like [Andrena cerasifolii]|uniref:chymotrypsin-1-like n=1 Tax=Andrena cerasifolii TaxID=2819439 RepID=UPI00403826AB